MIENNGGDPTARPASAAHGSLLRVHLTLTRMLLALAGHRCGSIFSALFPADTVRRHWREGIEELKKRHEYGSFGWAAAVAACSLQAVCGAASCTQRGARPRLMEAAHTVWRSDNNRSV